MKKWFLIFGLILMSISGYAQNKAVSQFTTSSTLANSDYFLLQTDSSGTYVWRKITYWKMLNLFQTRNDTLSGNNIYSGSSVFSGYIYSYNGLNIMDANGIQRWGLLKTGTEIGANAGSDLTLVAYDDNGIAIDTVFTITRSNQRMTLNQNLNITGTATMTGFKLTAATTVGYVLKTDANGNGTWQAGSGYTPDGITIIGNADSTLTTDLWLNIESFGAVGDSVTDNTTALQNAIDSASASNRTLFIPSGNYVFATGLTITTSGLTIRGESKRYSVLQFTGTGDAITVGSGTNTALGTVNTSIYDITLKGQAGTHNGLMLQNANELFVQNCRIEKFDNGMGQGVDTWTNTFIKVDFMDNDSSGIAVTGVWNLTNFTNCSWRRNLVDGINIGASAYLNGNTFTSCDWESNGRFGINALATILNCTIAGGWFEGNDSTDINGTDIYGSTISNGNFATAQTNNIFFNNILGGTKIYGNIATLATMSFIRVSGGSIINSVIGPNHTNFSGGGAHHLYVYSNYNDQEIFNNTTVSNDEAHGQSYNLLPVQTKVGMGKVRISSGDSTYTGLIEFYTPGAVRTGYFGYTSSAALFPLTLSSGVTFWIYGGDGVHIDSSLGVGGKITSGKRIYVSPDSLTSHNLDASLGNEFTFKLTKNDTLFITNMAEGQNLTVKVVNDSTWTCLFYVDGGVTNLRWKGGAAPTITTGTFAQRKRDLIIFKRSGYEYLAAPVQDFY